MNYSALTTHWQKVRKVVVNDLITCLPDGLANNQNDEMFNDWFTCFDQHFSETLLDRLNVMLTNLNSMDSAADIWEVMENAKTGIVDRIGNIDFDKLDSSKANGSIRNSVNQALDSSRKKYLLSQGVDKQYLDNLDNWYKIYPIVRELQIEMEGQEIDVVDEKFVKQLSERIKAKSLHAVTKENRLLDILFDFYHKVPYVGHEQLSDNGGGIDVDDIEGVETQYTRLEDCFRKLQAFSTEVHHILQQNVIEQKSAKSIFDSMGISNTKFNARKNQGIKLLRGCLEGQGQDALSLYEEDN